MNQYRLAALAALASLVLLASACQQPAPAVPVAEPAPAPVAAPAEPMPAAVAVASFDVRAFAGTFTGAPAGIDTRVELNADGSYRLVEAGAEPREVSGTWTAEENNTQVLLDPDSKTEADRRYAIASNDELRSLDIKTLVADPAESLRRQANP